MTIEFPHIIEEAQVLQPLPYCHLVARFEKMLEDERTVPPEKPRCERMLLSKDRPRNPLVVLRLTADGSASHRCLLAAVTVNEAANVGPARALQPGPRLTPADLTLALSEQFPLRQSSSRRPSARLNGLQTSKRLLSLDLASTIRRPPSQI